MRPVFLLIIPMMVSCLVLSNADVQAQGDKASYQKEIFWNLNGKNGIIWRMANETRLPHHDDIEMDGQLVACIIHYEVSDKKQLAVKREILYPQLRRLPQPADPSWFKYRAYLRDEYADNILPVITDGTTRMMLGSLDSVTINGKISFFLHASGGLQVIRSFYPSMDKRLIVEQWAIVNTSEGKKNLEIGKTEFKQQEKGLNGSFERKVFSDAVHEVQLLPQETYRFAIYYTARLDQEPELSPEFGEVEKKREDFLKTIRDNLQLETPSDTLNTMFYFSKIRAAESIYKTKMGLVHSPGGGNYYTGVWANDQAEYSGPFFPYLGYEAGNQAAMNAYKMFLRNIPEGNAKMWSSFEMDGDLPCCSEDRGDAAMIAFGATHFCLASGNRDIADTLWPLINWGLDYCEKKKNSEGVIASQTDELEGRFPSGEANLSTSVLYYGALLQAADLALGMGKPSKLIESYKEKAKAMAQAIELYFGADMDGLHTYRYYKGNSTLRSWICLPLVVGLQQRTEGTLDALFSKLWTDNGVRTELAASQNTDEVFWDRGTLYAFRGAFKAGAADRGLSKLSAYSSTRLIGYRVPYAVEAWPENQMAQLSAESALYCRIFTEGILGIQPKGFHRFSLQPHLPSDWNFMRMKHVKLFGSDFDIDIKRETNLLRLIVRSGGVEILNRLIHNGDLISVDLKR